MNSGKREKPYPSRQSPYSRPKRRRPLPVDAAAATDNAVEELSTVASAAATKERNTVVVVGVPAECSVLDLKSRFEMYGPISRTLIESNGVAYVNFRSSDAAQSAVNSARDPSFPVTLKSIPVQVIWSTDPIPQWERGIGRRDGLSSKLVRAELPLSRHGRDITGLEIGNQNHGIAAHRHNMDEHLLPKYDEVELEELGGNGYDYSSFFKTSNQFESVEALHAWADERAKAIGFRLIRASYKTSSVPGRLSIHLRCWRYGKYRGKVTDLDKTVRSKTKTKACQCPFVIVAKTLSPDHSWYVQVYSGDKGKHNHNFIVYDEGQQHGNRFSDEMKVHVREMTAMGCTPATIHTSLKQKFPDSNSNVVQIYNERSKSRVKEMDGRMYVQHCLQLANEHGYVSWTDMDDDGTLRQIFMCHPFAAKLVHTYPYVILIDSTYKTNATKWSFCEIVGVTPTNHKFLAAYSIMRDERKESYTWVLARLKNLLGERLPNVFITDRNEALEWALRDVFPGVSHFLCLWHIGNDVEKKVNALTGGRKLGQGGVFRKTWWSQIVNAESLADYTTQCKKMENYWIEKNKKVLEYVNSTWLKYKEKFVRAFTDDVAHMGNMTTSRAKNQQSTFKYYLGTGRGTFDMLWKKGHDQIENQHTMIKKALEDSRSSHLTTCRGSLYKHLHGKVSHYAIALIAKEFNRLMTTQAKELNCDHWLQRTHSLPCICTLGNLESQNGELYLNSIGTFWKTLVVGDGVLNSETCDGHVSQDFAYFESLVNKVRQSDPTVVRHVSHVLGESLHPKNGYIPEPNASPQRRGRPSIGQTTRCQPSVFDYNHGCVRGERSSSSSTTGRGSRGSNSVDLGVEGPKSMSATAFPWPNDVPTLILPYIVGWFDVVGDGNCGFRVIAEVGFGGQHAWAQARRTLCAEIGSNMMQYNLVYEIRSGLQEALDRIGRHMYGAAPLHHWIETPTDLYAAATHLNCIFVNLAIGKDAAGAIVDQSGTVFPLRAFPGATGPEKIIGIAFVNHNHYVQVHLHDDCPLPRPYVNWYTVRHNSVDGWDEPYAHRFAMWANLGNVHRNNDDFQVFDLGDGDE